MPKRPAEKQMSQSQEVSLDLTFHPLTPERWSDLERLFGQRGACGGCWCMYWRFKRSEFEKQKGGPNKQAFKNIVTSGDIPGILATAGGQPIGWCSSARREVYPVLERSRILKRVDDQPVWSVVCFFVAQPYQRKGASVKLLEAAVACVRHRGGRLVQPYPVEPKKVPRSAAFAWTGLASAFRKAGFVEALRRSETRPIMRDRIGKT